MSLLTAIPFSAFLLVAAGVYIVVLGGTTIGETDPSLRLASGVVGGALIAAYMLRGPARMDRVDRGVLIALLLFLATAVLSAFPRQSFDAALTALAFAAGLFVARGAFGEERVRAVFPVAAITISAVLTLLFSQLWLSAVLEWWARLEFRVVPPLNFELAGFPWGHRHDLTMLVAILYPAWWVGTPSRLRRVAAIVFGFLAALIATVDGSRVIWLAVAVATAIPALAWLGRRRWTPRTRVVTLIVFGVIVAALALSGVGSTLLERGVSGATVDWRTAMWGPLIEQWATQPLAGAGPGSYPWILQPTGYFDTNSWAPRHPDSVIVQTLAETGLLGVVGVGLIIGTVGPAVWRGRSHAARWALTVVAIGSLGATPTEFAFLVVVAIGWVAYSVPRQDSAAIPPNGLRRQVVRIGIFALLVPMVLAYGAVTVGAFAYEQSRAAIEDGRLGDALGPLQLAGSLDPAMALYPRQRGALRLLTGDADRAVAELEHAVRLNANDDLAWRTLAVARDARGDQQGRDEAIATAVRLQRSDPTNLLLRAYWDGRDGASAPAAATLAEAMQAWPTLAYAPGWADIAGAAGGSLAVIDQAAARWASDAPMPERAFDQGMWLGPVTDRPEFADQAAAKSPWGEPLARAAMSEMTCGPTDIEQLEQDALRTTLYWELRARSAAAEGARSDMALRMSELMGNRISDAAVNDTLNPLHENGLGRGDRWGYRRQPISWPTVDIELPSSDIGRVRWILEPEKALAESGLEARFGTCEGIATGRERDDGG